MKTLFLVLGLLCACSVQKAFVPVGGSRADATIEMAFDYGGLQVPKWDKAQADAGALERCKAWGYNGAEAFGSYTSRCVQFGSKSCNVYRMSMTYQCLGSGSDVKK